ncbi:element excision factor XisH family protein [Coleofasciculus sp. E1-EBD-02]|uniref:element excision factor XisH family protein n=1 Tax=Coleofasciculus sp. E1-EBD-02 TaxID=3068481 RepID=UPI0032F27DF5
MGSVRILYLAVPTLIYNSLFQLDFPASMLQENTVKMMVYDIELEKISRGIIVTNKYHPLEVEHRPNYPAKTQVTIPVARCDASP